MTIAVPIVAIIIGFAGLIWSADRFVAGAAGIARNMGMAPIMIGLTIVAFGTSAPEIIVSINAALDKAGDLAIGNAIGSNLANIGLDHDIKQDRQKYSRDNGAQGMGQAKPDFCKRPEQAWSRHRHDQKPYS